MRRERLILLKLYIPIYNIKLNSHALSMKTFLRYYAKE